MISVGLPSTLRPIVAAFALATAASALPASAQDSRLVERLYDPMEVVRLEGRVKVQATIRFGEDESIENVAIGDSMAWQVTPNKRANLLFVKPLTPTARTNMTWSRTSTPTCSTWSLRQGEAALFARLHLSRRTRSGHRRVRKPAAHGWRYHPMPSKRRRPAIPVQSRSCRVNGMGRQRRCQPAGRDLRRRRGDLSHLACRAAVPAILVKDYEGTEGPVNFTVRGDTIVIDGTPAEIVLRLGDDSATLVNAAPPSTATQRPRGRGSASLANRR